MSPRQMGQGGMAGGGVVAPGCVQSWWVGSPSSMGPPSSSVRSTIEVFWLLMLRERKKVQDGGGQRNPTTSAEVILASVQICTCV